MKVSMFKKCIGAALLMSLAGGAWGTNVFNLRGYGSISRAMGGTAAAFDVGTAALMANPATLSLMSERPTLDVGLDTIMTNDIIASTSSTAFGTTPTSVTSSRDGIGRFYYAPHFGVAMRFNRITAGVGAFAQGGLGVEFGNNSFLSSTAAGVNGGAPTNLENQSRLLVLRVPLGISFKVNDRISVGASIDGVWTGLNLGLLLDSSQLGALAGAGRLNGSLVPPIAGLLGAGTLQGAHFNLIKSSDIFSAVNRFGIGGKIGLTFDVFEGTRLGVAYNFKETDDDLTGRATLTAIDRNLGQVPLRGDIKIRNFSMPASVIAGLSQSLMDDRLLLTFDYQHVFWADVFENIDVGFVSDHGQALDGYINILLPLDLNDVDIFSLGASYKFNDKLTLRMGGSFSADEPHPNNPFYAIIPAILKNHITFGLGYKFTPQNEVNFSYTHAFKEDFSNPGGNATSTPPITLEHTQDNFSLTYTHRF